MPLHIFRPNCIVQFYMLHIDRIYFFNILYVSWNSIYWCTFLIRTSFLRSIMFVLNTYTSALHGHYYFHEHTELCFTANTCKPSCGMSYLLTERQAQHWKVLCSRVIRAGLLLCNFFFCNFALTWLENLHNFSNLSNNVRFHVIWQDDMR